MENVRVHGSGMPLLMTHLIHLSYTDKKSEENVLTSMAAVGGRMIWVEWLTTPSAPSRAEFPWWIPPKLGYQFWKPENLICQHTMQHLTNLVHKASHINSISSMLICKGKCLPPLVAMAYTLFLYRKMGTTWEAKLSSKHFFVIITLEWVVLVLWCLWVKVSCPLALSIFASVLKFQG